ncbi:hypothetical protein P865_05485 [Brucella abortus 82]|nr:hypothetical protein BMNI_I0247 [Brucella melitensis NI]EPZ76669.1 hypothetical protein M798_01940 [Brucella melitensis ADMAS-G1]ERM04332.1 hypothetical protein P408_12985 [Brucella abortus S99]ERM86937.1 hypothetical protein P865_05485 [Brucella abortus 82]
MPAIRMKTQGVCKRADNATATEVGFRNRTVNWQGLMPTGECSALLALGFLVLGLPDTLNFFWRGRSVVPLAFDQSKPLEAIENISEAATGMTAQ